jgi:hypothetical protein
MAQRASGYERDPLEFYVEPTWAVAAILDYLGPLRGRHS